MLKTIIIVSIVVILIPVEYLISGGDFYEKRHLLNPNNIEVINESILENDLIKITWFSHDFEEELVVYEKSKYLNPVFKEYGNNYFYTYYNDSLIAKCRHFKTNNWHGHNYTFYLYKKQDSIIVTMHLKGPDADLFYHK